MNIRPIPQHYWNNTIVQPVKAADKPRDEGNQQRRFKEILEKQMREFRYAKQRFEREDGLTTVLIFLVVLFGIGMVFSQIGIATGEITSPGYLGDFI